MTRVREVLGARSGPFSVWMLLAALALGFAFAAPALGTFGSNPSKECSNTSWNGEYWKAEIDDRDFSVDDIQTSANVADNTISVKIDKYKKATWSLRADAKYGIFRIYEKGGQYSQTNSGFWLPGQGGTFSVEKSISHITFCFKNIPKPSISIEKKTNGADPTASNPNYVPVGNAVTWTYEVKNTGSVALKDVVVSDSDPALTVVKVTGDSLLDPGEKWTYKATGTARAGAYTNTGTVTAQSKLDSGPTGSVTASNGSGYFGSNPSISIVVDGPDEGSDPEPDAFPDIVNVGDPVIWTFTVTNTGNVPLRAVVVLDLGAPGAPDDLVVCDLPDMAPGAVEHCVYQQDATAGEQTTIFQVLAEDPIGGQAAETTGSVGYTGNEIPIAVLDEYETAERVVADEALAFDVAAPGLLANDDDPDGDPMDLTAHPETLISDEGASVEVFEDGAFTYVPAVKTNAEWAQVGGLSYVDTWEYTALDPDGGSASGTVKITVTRQLCVNEPVVGPPGLDISAVFTLIASSGCKDFPLLVVQDGVTNLDGTVLFQPPTQGITGDYVGVLTVNDLAITVGDLDEVVLRYDPTGGDIYQFVPACDGSSTEPVLPDEAMTGWCFYDIDFDLDAGLWDITWFVYGVDDPKFVFK